MGSPSPWMRVKKLRDDALAYYHADARRAQEIAAAALEVALATDDPRAHGWGYRAAAESSLFAGRMRESDRAYRAATKAFAATDDPATLGQLLVGHVHVLTHLGDPAAALATAIRARELLTRAGDTVYLAKLAMNLGNYHAQGERPREALAEYDTAARILRRRPPQDGTLLGLEINRGVALTQLDRHPEALVAFARILDAPQAGAHPILVAQARMNAAYVHGLRAEVDQALAAWSRAGAVFEAQGHPKLLGSCLLGRAEILNQLNLHDRASALAAQARDLFAEAGLPHDEGLAELELALAALGRGDPAGAAPHERRARRRFAREGNEARLGVLDLLRAEADHRRGRKARAQSTARSALDRFRTLGLRRWEGRAAVLLARMGTPGAASRITSLARSLDATLYPLLAFEVHEVLGELHERRGRLREARAAYARAVDILGRTRSRIPTEESKLAFLRDKSGVHHRRVGLELRRSRPDPDALFRMVEGAKAQALGDRLRDPGRLLEGDGGPALPRARERDRRHLSWLHMRLARVELQHPERTAEIDSRRSRLLEAEARWSRLAAEAAEARESRRPATTPTVPGIDEARARIPRGFGLLSWFVTPETALLLAITQDEVRWCRLPATLHARVTELADRLDFLWAAASVASAREARAAGTSVAPVREARVAGTSVASAREARAAGTSVAPVRGAQAAAARPAPSPEGDSERQRRLRGAADLVLGELDALLWEPVRALVPVPRRGWILSPHGPLHRVPFGALKGSAGYLVETTELGIIPSVGVWMRTPARRRRGPSRAYVAGVTSPRLPAIRGEISAVRDHLSGWEIEVDFVPHRERVLAEATRADLLHLAAHGALRVDNPAFSFVELADGPLYLHDLFDQRLPGSTVVLTACSTARGVSSAGDEWLGMARGFLQAGASAVIGSLWPIHDAATKALVNDLYAGIGSGDRPSRALRRAAGNAIRSGRGPWEWGAFVIYGFTERGVGGRHRP